MTTYLLILSAFTKTFHILLDFSTVYNFAMIQFASKASSKEILQKPYIQK